MKTKLALFVAAVAALCVFAACGKQEPAKPEPTTPAGILLADFQATAKDNSGMTTEQMAEHLIENEIITFGPAYMPVEPGFLNGFTEEITGFSEGTMFGPMIGSIPFIGYVLKADGDAAKLVETLKDKHDLRWNICTQADEMMCEAAGDLVFFVMAPASLEE